MKAAYLRRVLLVFLSPYPLIALYEQCSCKSRQEISVWNKKVFFICRHNLKGKSLVSYIRGVFYHLHIVDGVKICMVITPYPHHLLSISLKLFCYFYLILSWPCILFLKVERIYCHRMVEVGRKLWKSSGALLPRTMSSWPFSISKDGDFTISLGNLDWCSISRIMKKCFWVPRWNRLCFSLCPLTLVLSQNTIIGFFRLEKTLKIVESSHWLYAKKSIGIPCLWPPHLHIF